MNFLSDNSAPVHPQVMAALAQANDGYSKPYGNDTAMDDVRTKVREIFEAPDAAVYLVATGTAANALSLASHVQPWEAIFCHDSAHIHLDECGAPEFFTGGSKLVPVDGPHGKLNPQKLATAVQSIAAGSVHSVQRGAVSITNITEFGAIYTKQEISDLSKIAKDAGLHVHMDGARFANALVSQDCSPADLTWKSGVDTLSFGGTKNGLMGVEAVILFDPEKAWEFELRRKRAGHLFSKHRFLSAQMQAYLSEDLWLQCARQANMAGEYLAQEIVKVPNGKLTHPAQANMVFAGWNRGAHKRLQAVDAGYELWPHEQTLNGPDDGFVSARLVCSWCTTRQEIDGFVELIAQG